MKFLTPSGKVLRNSFLLVPYAASVYTWVSVCMRVIVLENSFIFYSVTHIFYVPCILALFLSSHICLCCPKATIYCNTFIVQCEVSSDRHYSLIFKVCNN